MTRCLVLLLVACADPVDTDPPAKGIEITGYLDASRVAVTLLEPLDGPTRARIVGQPEATDGGGEVTVTGTTELVLPVGEDGSFVGDLEVEDGLQLVIAREGAEPLALTVSEQPPFPDVADVVVHGPDDHDQVTVELVFVAPLAADLDVVLSSASSHEVALMTVSGTTAQGTITATSGDHLVVHGHHPVDGATAAMEIGVP